MVLVVAAVVLILDQASKAIVVATRPGEAPVELLGGLLTLTYVRNPGAAFSIGTGTTWVFTIIAAVVAVVIVRTSARLRSLPWALALGALLGGSLGNLSDRIFRAPGVARGYVVDWIQLPHWPVFNVADMAIVGAAVGMVLLSLAGRELDGTVHRG
ncbi:MAG: signal peptidase II [Actinomycetia bacterium]|nr:signal peptidase II [Actinomycetes bacterium]